VFSGGGRGTTIARRLKDATQARLIHQSWQSYAQEFGGVMPPPSLIARSSRGGLETTARGPEDISLNATAHVYSACIMQNYFLPELTIVSLVEPIPVVEPMRNDAHDYSAFLPAQFVYWDATFKADLQTGSNVTYGHVPIYGRLRIDHWGESPGDSKWPILGNPGPLNGENEPQSYTFKFCEPVNPW
jgi:hypothetical protein